MTTETDEERLHRICCSARDTYFNEEQAGKLPNLALIIRDAVLDYAAPPPDAQGMVMKMEQDTIARCACLCHNISLSFAEDSPEYRVLQYMETVIKKTTPVAAPAAPSQDSLDAKREGGA